MKPQREYNNSKLIDFHGICLNVDFDFYQDDLSVELGPIAVVVDGIEVDELDGILSQKAENEIIEILQSTYLRDAGDIEPIEPEEKEPFVYHF